ncbi:GTPase domain-containing protein [Mycolicibacterium sp.]|uniref:GTPase domain-containing protein n=1 Tax=Mycolicibacterium sp. TaxID=2320850 RepID=UPI0028A6BC08|nr:GTPase domain-containing protein [Mycolicibacterium sp.]
MSGSLLPPLESLRGALGQVRIPLPVAGADAARGLTGSFTNQLDDYILPRLRDADAPLLAVVGGSTGSGKSTLVNRLVGRPVTTPGVLRPTTRHPVLACNPVDADWFASDHILPRLPRITGGASLGGVDDVFGLRLVDVDEVPAGVGLLDAPDLDSVSQTNREMAGMLMSAADLWFFVTTASRYADAVPWAALRAAVDRNAAVVIVLNRVPAEAMAEVTAHLRELLAQERLGGAPLFVIPESPLVDGMLPADRTADLQAWLNHLVADAAMRAAVARRTMDGAVGQIVADMPAIADAVGQQLNTASRLRESVDQSYARAVAELESAASDGSLMRGEVLARWQEFVGTGQLLKRLEEGVGRLRDKISAAVRGEPTPPERVAEAIESGLASLLVDSANEASRRAELTWRQDDAGRALLGGSDLARASADLPDRAAALVRSWQDDLLEMIRTEGADKRQTARAMAYGLNAVTLALMVVVFSATGGLTGTEIGIAGASTVLAQKLLEAVFGEDGVRRMSKIAMSKLNDRVEGLMDEEKSRFLSRLDALELDPELPARLQAATHQVQLARHGEDAEAMLPASPPAPGEHGAPRRKWRDSLRDWWNG